jgi:hypothetical protein
VTGRALLLAALALAGCGAVQGMQSRLPPRSPQPSPEVGDLAEVRDAATRQDQLYDGFVHRATAVATWLSPAVREATARLQAGWQGWSEAELAARLEAGRAEASGAAGAEVFVVSLYTAERRDNDLDAKKSVWRIELDDGTTKALASRVTVEDVDATLLQLFPYVGPFDIVYRVVIPWTGAPLPGRPFTLRISGAVGRLTLDFGPGGKRAERPHQAP